MNVLPIRRLAATVLGIVILFTPLALAAGQLAFARGVWLALGWQAASVACLALGGRCLRWPASKRRGWALAGVAFLKFPFLYTLGYWLVRWIHPSAVGLAVGLTIPWCVIVIYAVVTLLRNAFPSTART